MQCLSAWHRHDIVDPSSRAAAWRRGDPERRARCNGWEGRSSEVVSITRSLPIGNLTSQFFANVSLNRLDHFATEVLRAPYLRDVDDFALFADDAGQLAAWRDAIAGHLARRRLILHPRKTAIRPTEEPARFLGFVMLPGGRRRLLEDNVTRLRGRPCSLRDRHRTGRVERPGAEARMGAWLAHAAHADTFRLRAAIFPRGWFARREEPAR
jgi:hypothetical protein